MPEPVNLPPDPRLNLTINSIAVDAKKTLEERKKLIKIELLPKMQSLDEYLKSIKTSNETLVKITKEIIESPQDTTIEAELTKNLKEVQSKTVTDKEQKFNNITNLIAERVQESEKNKATMTRFTKDNEFKISNTLKKTKTTIDKGFNKLVTAGTALKEKSEKMRKVVGGSFCPFFNNKIANFFNIFLGKGKGFVSFVVNGGFKMISTVFSWVKNSAIFIVEKMWTVLSKLAKIGWVVISTAFSVLATPIISVTKFFVNAFTNFISTPLGLLTAIATVTIAAYFFSDTIKDFFSTIASTTWNWITTNVESLIGKDNVKFIKDKYKQITDYIYGFMDTAINFIINPDGLRSYYDKYIGNYIGLPSAKIQGYFTQGVNFIEATWNSMVSYIIKLQKQDVLDELLIFWGMLRNVYYTIKSGFKKDAYKNELKIEENYRIANEKLRQTMQTQAELKVQKDIIDFYLNNFNSTTDKTILTNLMIKAGNDALQKYKDLKSQNVTTKPISDGINVNIESIVNTILRRDYQSNKSINTSLENTINQKEDLIEQATSILQDYRTKLPDKVEEISYAVDQLKKETKYTKLTIDNLPPQFREFLNSGIWTSEFTPAIGPQDKTGIIGLKDFSKNELTRYNEGLKNTTKGLLSDLIRTFYSAHDKLPLSDSQLEDLHVSLIDFFGKYSKQAFTLNPRLGGNQMKMFYEHLDDYFNELYSKYTIKHDPIEEVKQARGGVITGPVHALIGEAGSPEIVIPLNADGLNFIISSMSDLMDEKYPEEQSNDNNKTLVTRLRKGNISHKDPAIYDMSNVAKGIIRVN